jgi:WD40 repeat protein
VWDATTGDRLRSLPLAELGRLPGGNPLAERGDGARLTFGISPDGSRLFASRARRAVVFDADPLRVAGTLGLPSKHFQAAAFTPGGRHLITVSNEATARLWDAATWEQSREYAWKAGPLKCVAVSPDGTLAAAGSSRGKVVVWDLDL